MKSGNKPSFRLELKKFDPKKIKEEDQSVE